MLNPTARRRRVPEVKFRVLIAGRANAGKTSILQRVCDTTKSPKTYRILNGKRTKIQLSPTSDRGEHKITDELVFSNHGGYLFHDSCGLESGSMKELETLREFIREHAQKSKLKERLHAIWYCIPMDDRRPGLNVEPLNALRLDESVPVIAIFTKFDAFRRNIRMDLEDAEEKAGDDLDSLTDQKCQEIFQRECLDRIGNTTPFLRLKGMNDPAARCDDLIRKTTDALNGGAVTLMLLAVQTKNLELSVRHAVQMSLRVVEPSTKSAAPVPSGDSQLEDVVKKCLAAFPELWWIDDERLDLFDLRDLHDELHHHDRDFLLRHHHYDFRLNRPLVQSLLTFARNHQSHLVKDKQSHLSLLIALILVLRYATITFANKKITKEAALDESYQRHSASYVSSKTAEWVAFSTTQTKEHIVAFINSIPWDMNSGPVELN